MFERLVEELTNAKSVTVAAHMSPDPDAVGSAVAAALGLRSRGIGAEVYLCDPVPRRISPLVGDIFVLSAVPETPYDGLLVVDTATKERLGPEADLLCQRAGRVWNVDHHVSNARWGDVNIIGADAAASAELVLRLLGALDVDISSRVATLLLAGLMDDTGSFRYSNVTAESFRVAAELVELGARAEDVSEALYFSVPEGVVRMRAECMRSLERYFNGALSMVVLREEDLERWGLAPEDTEGVVDLARGIEGVEASVFVRQDEDRWKVSLRAKDPAIDVNAIAQKFGGGGHRAAAGCRMRGTEEEVREKLLAGFRESAFGGTDR